MKIVQINTFQNGSTGKIADAIHEELLKEKFDSYFFYGIGKCFDERKKCFESSFSVHLHSLMSRLIGLQGYFSIFATKRLIKNLKTIEPDIVHLHNYHGSYLNLKILLKYVSKSNVSLLITLHDCLLFTGKCPHFTRVKCYKWKKECNKCPQLKRYPSSLIFDFSKKIFNDKKTWLSNCRDVNIITVSDWLMKEAKESYLKQFPIKRIYNGIDLTKFYFRDPQTILEKYHLNNKQIILGVSSVWSVNKGLDKIIELSSNLKSDEIIVLVGMEKSQMINLPKNILGIEKTESVDELCQWYSSALVLISMSIEETFGLIVVEAMACGTPVIVFDSTACGEIVDEQCGFVIDLDDMNNIHEYIERVRDFNFNRTAISKYAHDCFNDKRMIGEYISEYKQIYASRQA